MRPIDADELLNQIKYKPVPNIITETWNELYDRVLDEIDNAQTIEYTFEEAFQKTVCENRLYCPARPKGNWILCEDTYFSKCSICGDIWLNEECKNYCPNCGAEMRKGSQE